MKTLKDPLCRVSFTGFPIKDARFSKLKNFPDLNDDKEGKIKENVDLKYFSNRAWFWETLR